MRVRERERGHSILYSYREFCGLESQSLWLRFTAKQSEYLFNIMPANFGMKGKNSSVQRTAPRSYSTHGASKTTVKTKLFGTTCFL